MLGINLIVKLNHVFFILLRLRPVLNFFFKILLRNLIENLNIIEVFIKVKLVNFGQI